MKKSVLQKILLLVGGITLGLLALEITLTAIHFPYSNCPSTYPAPQYTLSVDPDLGWGYTSNTKITSNDGIEYVFNTEGYRTDTQSKLTNVTKPLILIVGDSILLGHRLPFSESFGYQLQKRLGDRYEVLNFSVIGYGTDQIVLKTKKLLDVYHPAYVITDFIEDHANRNVNQDRRIFSSCVLFASTKPLFTIKNGRAVYTRKPELYTTYDSPKVRLAWRWLVELLRQRIKPYKQTITALLLDELQKYTESKGAKLLLINVNSDGHLYQSEDTALTRSSVQINIQDKKYTLPNDAHPNETGTTYLVEQFVTNFPQYFAK